MNKNKVVLIVVTVILILGASATIYFMQGESYSAEDLNGFWSGARSLTSYMPKFMYISLDKKEVYIFEFSSLRILFGEIKNVKVISKNVFSMDIDFVIKDKDVVSKQNHEIFLGLEGKDTLFLKGYSRRGVITLKKQYNADMIRLYKSDINYKKQKLKELLETR